MKLLTLTILTTVVLSHSVFSSSGQDMVVTLSDTLYGEVQVDIVMNKVRIRIDKNYQYLTASQVRWIQQSDRHFCVAAFGEDSRYMIFEVLSKGAKALLYREGVKFNIYDEDDFPPYFVLHDRSAYSVGTKKEMLSVFGDLEKKVKAYAKIEGLSFESKTDLSRIFDYYNFSE